MATISEKWVSRSGSICGPWGISNVSRFFHVTVDLYDDEPGLTIQDQRITNSVPPGQVHPKFPGLFSVAYERGERLSTKVYPVRVWYGDPLAFPVEQKYWDIQIVGDFEEEDSFFDLDGKPIGHPAFERWPPDTSAPGYALFSTLTKHGPRGLILPSSAYSTGGANGPEFARNVQFHARPLRIPSETGTVMLRRLTANYPRPLGIAFGARGSVNSGNLVVTLGDGLLTLGPKGQFLLDRVTLTQQRGFLTGQRIINTIWEIGVDFRYRKRKWTPHILRTMYVDEDGLESEVKDAATGQPLDLRFRVMRETDHTQVLNELLTSGGEINIGPVSIGPTGDTISLSPIRTP